MKRGFTLAEVLITLGIIGVVAAMTLPTLISNTNSKKFAAQYKKSVSTLKQAILMAEAHYDMNLGNISSTCKNGATDTMNDKTICGLLNSTLSGATFLSMDDLELYAKGVVFGSDTSWQRGDGGAIGYILADGSMLILGQKEGVCSSVDPCAGFIDVNGKTLPNKEVSGTTLISYNDLIMPAAYADITKESANIGNLKPISGKLPIEEAVPDKVDDKIDLSKFTVPSDNAHMTDIYPIYLFDQSVTPATPAAQFVLTGSPVVAYTPKASTGSGSRPSVGGISLPITGPIETCKTCESAGPIIISPVKVKN